MKNLVIGLALLSSASAFAERDTYFTGDKIEFQKDSTWVSALYSKTLCLNGDTYEAIITKCAEYSNDDERRCERTIKVKAFQPMVSTRQRCDRFGGSDDNRCDRWVTVPFVQNPERIVKFYEGSTLVRTQKVVVPACN